ncbi:MAG TPA: LuxR C-terminal-related transcriptional regulator [Jiangellaceae bacterium]|nr:LuxR C-terminal-related transcriptional regulator [Jiangellaceae bacterium]
MTDALREARDAYQRRDWSRAVEWYEAAGAQGGLSGADAGALADAAWWLGRIDESNQAHEQGYRRQLDAGEPRAAAMSAIALAVNLLLRGDDVLGSAWMTRARRLLDDDRDSPEYGYVLFLTEVEANFGTPNRDGALDAARQVQELGRRHSHPELVVAGTMGEGRILIKQGAPRRGVARLDEALVMLLTEELSPDWAGDVYCNLMAAAVEMADVQRAIAWTEATSRWLTSLPAAVLFTGICRLHRSQVLQLQGAWEQAMAEAERASTDLADIQPASAAEAHYQLGEIHRLRGALRAAEQAYDAAHRLGRDPQPGIALLHLDRGRADAASASIRAALVAEPDRLARARLCAAQVEIAVATGDDAAARKASEELAETAAHYGSSGLELMARYAHGAALLASGHPEEALPVLREACHRWNSFDAPFECARIRLLLATAYRTLGDGDAAVREEAAAAAVYDRLGAAWPVAAGGRPGLPRGLTEREAEVLALVAAGRTNREAAATLVISEKTVARHLANIYAKLGVSSRTAANAFAFENGLASRAGQ